MKHKRIGKYILLALLCLCPVLTGAKLLDVEIKNADEPLVDLGVLLQKGGSYLPNDMLVSAESDPSEDGTDAEDGQENASERQIKISVRGTAVFLNGEAAQGKPFELRFRELYTGKESVVLTDDYAAYRTYKEIADFLKEQGISYDTGASR